jgi:uncharacterized protein YfaT (DUF1175 family)
MCVNNSRRGIRATSDDRPATAAHLNLARALRVLAACLVLLLAQSAADVCAQVRLRTESDRAALREWFLLLADAQFYRPTADVADCAGLIRHALREGLRPHSAEWIRLARLPFGRLAPDVADRPAAVNDALPIFLVRRAPPTYAEFADARTIVELNAQFVGRDPRSARPGDLLYFRQPAQTSPDHLMIFLGTSTADVGSRDWVVYHTGPDAGVPGEVRKVRVADLLQHPSARWRPTPANEAFVGVFRLRFFS